MAPLSQGQGQALTGPWLRPLALGRSRTGTGWGPCWGPVAPGGPCAPTAVGRNAPVSSRVTGCRQGAPLLGTKKAVGTHWLRSEACSDPPDPEAPPPPGPGCPQGPAWLLPSSGCRPAHTPPAGLGAAGAPTSSGTRQLDLHCLKGRSSFKAVGAFFVIVVILLSLFLGAGVAQNIGN